MLIRPYNLSITLLLILISIYQVNAQQKSVPSPVTTGICETKIAIINTNRFGDEKTGIAKLVNAVKIIKREFEPQQTELKSLKDKYQVLIKEINQIKSTPAADPKTVQPKIEQAEEMRKSLERKASDSTSAYNKRLESVIGPVYQDITKSIEVFAKERGIGLMLDAAKVGRDGAILALASCMDLTDEFIADYNKKNPATSTTGTK
jgi:Skp family chaperone for outer membrane proteins